MAASDEDVPHLSYLFAVCAGLAALPFIHVAAYYGGGDLLSFLAEGSADFDYGSVGGAGAVFALSHAALGAFFGLLWPEKTWRWGVWLCGLPSLVACFAARDGLAFLTWEALTLLPACAVAYAAGRAHLKFTAVDESG